MKTNAIGSVKVWFLMSGILQYKIAKQMNTTESKYTHEWLRSFKGLENLTDEEATLAISSLQEFTTTIMSLQSHNMNDKEIDLKLKQAA